MVEGDRIDVHTDGRRDLVVIGASAGGVEVLTRVVRDLPADLHAAVCVVLHVAPGSPSVLAKILNRAATLPCRPARDGEALCEGVILVASPDHHLVIEDGHARVTTGPRENGHRPAIDVLFRSAARALDSRVVGVVLSGTRDDGTAGLAAIKARGGAAIVQDPADAMYAGMPASAIASVAVDAVVPAALVGSTIAEMINGEDPPPSARRDDPAADPSPPDAGPVTAIRPECGEALGDRAALLRRLALQSERRGQSRSARRFRRQAHSASEQAEIVRQALAGAAGTTLLRGSDADDAEHAGEGRQAERSAA
jgi:CheB methylesterase